MKQRFSIIPKSVKDVASQELKKKYEAWGVLEYLNGCPSSFKEENLHLSDPNANFNIRHSFALFEFNLPS